MTPVVHPISNQQSASAREPSIVQPSLNHAASHHLGNASSTQYYEQVLQHNDNVSDFFRHFEAPEVGHCAGGPGPMPNAAMEQLVGRPGDAGRFFGGDGAAEAAVSVPFAPGVCGRRGEQLSFVCVRAGRVGEHVGNIETKEEWTLMQQ